MKKEEEEEKVQRGEEEEKEERKKSPSENGIERRARGGGRRGSVTALPAPGPSRAAAPNLLLSGSLERGSAIFARPAPWSFVCGCCRCCWGGSCRLGGLLLLRRLRHRHHQALVLR